MVCMFMSVVISHKDVTGNCIDREIFIRHSKTVQRTRQSCERASLQMLLVFNPILKLMFCVLDYCYYFV
jgi:hypothetical protein